VNLLHLNTNSLYLSTDILPTGDKPPEGARGDVAGAGRQEQHLVCDAADHGVSGRAVESRHSGR